MEDYHRICVYVQVLKSRDAIIIIKRNWQIARERFRRFSFVKRGKKKEWHDFPARAKNDSLRDAGASVATRYLACHWLLCLFLKHTHKSNATILFSFTCSRYRIERITSDYRTIALFAVKWRLIGKIWFVPCAWFIFSARRIVRGKGVLGIFTI